MKTYMSATVVNCVRATEGNTVRLRYEAPNPEPPPLMVEAEIIVSVVEPYYTDLKDALLAGHAVIVETTDTGDVTAVTIL